MKFIYNPYGIEHGWQARVNTMKSIYKVEVVNKQAERRRAGIWIDRRSVLGNPFKIGRDGPREQVIEQYRIWLRRQWKGQGKVYDELVRLAALSMHEPVCLLCWCKPLGCHGDVVVEAMAGIVKVGQQLMN